MRPSDSNIKKQLPFINVQPLSDILQNHGNTFPPSTVGTNIKTSFIEYILPQPVSSQLPKPYLQSSINEKQLNSVEWNNKLPSKLNVDLLKSSEKVLPIESFKPIFSLNEYEKNSNNFYPQQTLNTINESSISQILKPVISTPQPTSLILEPPLPFLLPPTIPLSIQPQRLIESFSTPPPIQILQSLLFPLPPPPLPLPPILISKPKVSTGKQLNKK